MSAKEDFLTFSFRNLEIIYCKLYKSISRLLVEKKLATITNRTMITIYFY